MKLNTKLNCIPVFRPATELLSSRARSEPGGTRWRTGGEVKGKLANGVSSHYSHATSECGLSSITQADAHTSAAGSRLNWRPHRFKWTRPFREKTKSGFCACAITFRTSYNAVRSSEIDYEVVCTLHYIGRDHAVLRTKNPDTWYNDTEDNIFKPPLADRSGILLQLTDCCVFILKGNKTVFRFRHTQQYIFILLYFFKYILLCLTETKTIFKGQ